MSRVPSSTTAADVPTGAVSNKNNSERQKMNGWKIQIGKERRVLQTNSGGVHEPGQNVYAYGHTFDEEATTQDVYESIGKSIISNVLKGYYLQ
jgi:hypothetical protein